MPVQAPAAPQTATIRMCIYYARNLVQSQLITVEVLDGEREGKGSSSWIDYTLTAGFRHVGDLPPRSINILANEASDGTHRLVFNGGRFHSIVLRDDQVSRATRDVRKALYSVHTTESGGHLGTRVTKQNRYDSDNRKPKEAFISDLATSARLGKKLWASIFARHPDVRRLASEALAAPGIMQIARTSGSTFAFPWALVYDAPLVIANPRKFTACPVVDDLYAGFDAERAYPAQCPHTAEHAPTTLCPYGFWGRTVVRPRED